MNHGGGIFEIEVTKPICVELMLLFSWLHMK